MFCNLITKHTRLSQVLPVYAPIFKATQRIFLYYPYPPGKSYGVFATFMASLSTIYVSTDSVAKSLHSLLTITLLTKSTMFSVVIEVYICKT